MTPIFKIGILITNVVWSPPEPPPHDPLLDAFTPMQTTSDLVYHVRCTFPLSDQDGYTACLAWDGDAINADLTPANIAKAEASVKPGECVIAVLDRRHNQICAYVKPQP